MTMTAAEAEADLKRMTAWDSRPALDQAAIDRLVVLARRQDSAGRWPADTGYLGDDATYDLNAAASIGWGWKANLVAGDFTFSADGASYDKAAVMAQCAEREQFYASKVRGSMNVGRSGYLGRTDYPAEELIP